MIGRPFCPLLLLLLHYSFLPLYYCYRTPLVSRCQSAFRPVPRAIDTRRALLYNYVGGDYRPVVASAPGAVPPGVSDVKKSACTDSGAAMLPVLRNAGQKLFGRQQSTEKL